MIRLLSWPCCCVAILQKFILILQNPYFLIANITDKYFSVNIIKNSNGSIFIDVGANIGTYSLALSSNFETILAFEPHPVVNKVLSLNKEINGFDPNMEVWQDLECWYNLLNNNGVAKRIKKEMYVVDISHPHERISNKKVEKVKRLNFLL